MDFEAQENSLFGNYKATDSITLLQRYEPRNGYHLSFSGGKDSVVLYDIAVKSGVKFDAHFANTTVEAPETMRFIRQNYPLVKWEKPRMTMRAAIIKKQYPPTRIVRYCCEQLKECHGSGRIILTGVRRAESTKRGKRKTIEVDWKDNTKIFIHPLFSWTTAEIWDYTKKHTLPVNPLYAEGRKRIGCVMCPMSGSEGMKRDAIRWPHIARNYKRWLNEMYDYHAAKGKSYKGWKSGDCIYQWWIEQPNKPAEEEACMLTFEG